MGDVGKEKSKFARKISVRASIHATFFKHWISSLYFRRISNLSSRHYTHYCTCYSYIMVYSYYFLKLQPFFLHLSSVSRFLSTATDSPDSLLLLFLLPALFFSFLPQFRLISLCLYLSFHLLSSLILFYRLNILRTFAVAEGTKVEGTDGLARLFAVRLLPVQSPSTLQHLRIILFWNNRNRTINCYYEKMIIY